MASLSIDLSERSSQVYVQSTFTMDVVLPSDADSSSAAGGWPHELSGVSGSNIASLFLGAVDIGNVANINGVE